MKRDVTFTLVETDLNQATRLHVFSNYRQTRTLAILAAFWFIAVAVLIMVGYNDWNTWPERLRDVAPIALMLVLLMLAAIFGAPLVLAPLAHRKRFRQDKLLRQPVTASWDDETYSVTGPNAQSRLAWRDYVFLRESGSVFTFATSNFNYQVLPKRVLTDEQIEDIRRIISANRT